MFLLVLLVVFPNPTELGENPAYDSLKDSRGIQAPYLYYGDIIGEDVKKTYKCAGESHQFK